MQITSHSVLERIRVKGSYLSQWLPQGERGPPKESKSLWIETVFQMYFDISNKQLITTIQWEVLNWDNALTDCILKQKKISEWSENFWKFLIFQNH